MTNVYRRGEDSYPFNASREALVRAVRAVRATSQRRRCVRVEAGGAIYLGGFALPDDLRWHVWQHYMRARHAHALGVLDRAKVFPLVLRTRLPVSTLWNFMRATTGARSHLFLGAVDPHRVHVRLYYAMPDGVTHLVELVFAASEEAPRPSRFR